MTDWIDRPGPVRDGEALDTDRLAAYLDERLPGAGTPLVVEQFPGGFSNLTYLLRRGPHAWVLRRPPPGVPAGPAHDVAREYRLLTHLYPAYPKVPRPLLFCDDPAVLGAPFYVMERVEGVILRARMPAPVPPDRMAAVADAFVDTLAELHAAEPPPLGRPEGYVRRQVTGWAERYRRARTDDIPTLERAATWLAEHAPPETGATLIHNDFKYDNLVLDPADWTRVRAVLDWEMATRGDPLMDLGTTLGYWVTADDPPALQALRLSPTTRPGNPTRTALVARYTRRTGRDPGDGVFYYVYGLFKVAVIVQQLYYRYRQGLSRDPRFASLADAVRACGAQTERAIERGRLDGLW